MNVNKVYFTSTNMEADEVVYVTDDHYNADYAAYPVQPIDADRKVFRTGNRHEANSVIVMTGSSQNPYVDYTGGYYSVGGGRTYGEPAQDRSVARSSSPAGHAYSPTGSSLEGKDVFGIIVRVVALGMMGVALIAFLIGLVTGGSTFGFALVTAGGAIAVWLGAGKILDPNSKSTGGAARDAGNFLFMFVYIVGTAGAIFVAPIIALFTLLTGNVGGAIAWIVGAVVVYVGLLALMNTRS